MIVRGFIICSAETCITICKIFVFLTRFGVEEADTQCFAVDKVWDKIRDEVSKGSRSFLLHSSRLALPFTRKLWLDKLIHPPVGRTPGT